MNMVLDLRREAAKAPISIANLGDITDDERQAALTNWRERMVSEHVSARVFAGLVPQLMRAGIAHRHIKNVSAMVSQELEHAVLCARAVAALGGEAVALLPEALPEVPSHADATALEVVLRNVLSISCCSETVAVALVATEREQAAGNDLRMLLEQILADEVRHARFGWKLLAEVSPQVDRRMKARLGAYLVAVFEHQIAFHAAFLGMPHQRDRAVAIGAADGPSNWQVFVDTMMTVTVPGLERHGLGARRAWEAAIEGIGKTSDVKEFAPGECMAGENTKNLLPGGQEAALWF